jgi:hypothetical protein
MRTQIALRGSHHTDIEDIQLNRVLRQLGQAAVAERGDERAGGWLRRS